jgi:hypothetical protein
LPWTGSARVHIVALRPDLLVYYAEDIALLL